MTVKDIHIHLKLLRLAVEMDKLKKENKELNNRINRIEGIPLIKKELKEMKSKKPMGFDGQRTAK